jgi:hypothetical protein
MIKAIIEGVSGILAEALKIKVDTDGRNTTQDVAILTAHITSAKAMLDALITELGVTHNTKIDKEGLDPEALAAKEELT